MKFLFILIALFTFPCEGAKSTFSFSVIPDAAEAATFSSIPSLVGPLNDQTSSLEVLGMTSNAFPQHSHTSETAITSPSLSITHKIPAAGSFGQIAPLIILTMTTNAPPPPSAFTESPIVSSLKTLEGFTMTTSPSTHPLLIPVTQTSILPHLSTTDGLPNPPTNAAATSLGIFESLEDLTKITSTSSPPVKTTEVPIPSSGASTPTLPNPTGKGTDSAARSIIETLATLSRKPFALPLFTIEKSSLKSFEGGTTITQASSSTSGTNSVTTITPFPAPSNTLPSPTANQTTVLYPKVPEYLTAESSCSIITTSCEGASFNWAIDEATTCFQCSPVQQAAATTLPNQSTLSASYVQYLASFVSSVAVNNVPTSSIDVVLLSKISIWTVGLPSQSLTATEPS